MNKTQLVAILMILVVFLGILSGACESPTPAPPEVTPAAAIDQIAPTEAPAEPAKLATGESDPTPPNTLPPSETPPAAPTEEPTAPTEAPAQEPAPDAAPTEAPAE